MPVKSDTDERGALASADELLQQSAAGNSLAFTALYDQTARRVYGLVTRVVVDPAQSEEVVQDAYLEIWQKARTFDPRRGKALSWMLTVAHQRAIDRVRSSQASRDRDLRIGVRDYQASRDDVADSVETKLESERVARAMQQITYLQRQVIDLGYFRGLSTAEISEMPSIPPSTVKTRMRDGLIKLRGAFDVSEQDS